MKTFIIICLMCVCLKTRGQPFNSVSSMEYGLKKVSLITVHPQKEKEFKSHQPQTQKEDSFNENYFSLPLKELDLTSSYGMRMHPIKKKIKKHQGIDLKAHSDTVKSILNGVITKCGNDSELGFFVQISHGTFETVYGHLSKYFVVKNESVTSGQSIGITGNTGISTGEHLHFEVRKNKEAIEPLSFMAKLTFYNKNYLNH